MGDYISADIGALEAFIQKSQDAVKTFTSIKDDFKTINDTLLKTWKGEGADAYKQEVDHIMENVGGIEEILKSINEGVINDIKNTYNQLDKELGEFNLNPYGAE